MLMNVWSLLFFSVFSVKKVRLFFLLWFVWNKKNEEFFLVIYCMNSIDEFVDSKWTKFSTVALFLTARIVNIQQNRTITQPGLVLSLSWIYFCQWRFATVAIHYSQDDSRSIIPLLHTGKQTHTHTYILTLTHVP